MRPGAGGGFGREVGGVIVAQQQDKHREQLLISRRIRASGFSQLIMTSGALSVQPNIAWKLDYITNTL